MDHAEKYDIINLVRKNILRCYASTAMLISIHSLIRGRTTSPKAIRSALLNFNPLPHTRENCEKLLGKFLVLAFQSTPSYEGEQG